MPHEGHLYGYSGNFLTCVDAATGEMVWKSRPPGQGILVLVDGHLVILIRSGEIVVAEATPEEYREVSRVQALDRGYFTRPSFAGGRVYVRNLADISAIGVTDARSADSAGAGGAGADWDLRGDFGAFVEKLAVAEKKSEMVESFLAEHPTLPILEGNLVHFVYHGEVDDLAVSGNFIRGGGEHTMHRVEGTDFYFRSYELPEKALFSYRFSVFDERMTDPANPQDRPVPKAVSGRCWRPPAGRLRPTCASPRASAAGSRSCSGRASSWTTSAKSRSTCRLATARATAATRCWWSSTVRRRSLSGRWTRASTT